MLPERPSYSGIETSQHSQAFQAGLREIDYPRRYRKFMTVYYVFIAGIVGGFYVLYMWATSGGSIDNFGSLIALMLMMQLSFIVVPILAIICSCLLVVSLRYLILNRLVGRLRAAAVASSILSITIIAVLCWYGFTLLNMLPFGSGQ